MTWTKTTTEFPDNCAEAGLSDAAYRTHHEAISYICAQENTACTIKKATMRRWAGSDRAQSAADELVSASWWIDHGTYWEIVHHAEVIRSSLTYQINKREGDKERKHRERLHKAGDHSLCKHPVTEDVTRDGASESHPESRTALSNYLPSTNEGSADQDEQIDYETGEVLPSAAAPSPIPESDSSAQQDRNRCPAPGCTAYLGMRERVVGFCKDHEHLRVA